jgi:serine/threonine protein kinase
MFAPIHEGAVVAARYRVVRILGQGGIGTLFVAEDAHLDQLVVVRLLRDDLAADAGYVARFFQELQRVGRIRSDFVARILDVGCIEAGPPFVVTEHLQGTTLAELSQLRGPMPISDVVRYARDACAGLADAHALGVVHGDLRVDKLFLAERPDGVQRVKILDFGVSRLPTTLAPRPNDDATAFLGTPSQRGADLAPPSRPIDVRADLRAMAWIMAKLVSGTVAYSKDGLRQSATPSQPDLNLGVPRELYQVIIRCMDDDPATRFRTADELSAALASLEGQAPASRRGARLPV